MCAHISITTVPNGANQFDNANNVGPQKEIILRPSLPSLGEERVSVLLTSSLGANLGHATSWFGRIVRFVGVISETYFLIYT